MSRRWFAPRQQIARVSDPVTHADSIVGVTHADSIVGVTHDDDAGASDTM